MSFKAPMGTLSTLFLTSTVDNLCMMVLSGLPGSVSACRHSRQSSRVSMKLVKQLVLGSGQSYSSRSRGFKGRVRVVLEQRIKLDMAGQLRCWSARSQGRSWLCSVRVRSPPPNCTSSYRTLWASWITATMSTVYPQLVCRLTTREYSSVPSRQACLSSIFAHLAASYLPHTWRMFHPEPYPPTSSCTGMTFFSIYRTSDPTSSFTAHPTIFYFCRLDGLVQTGSSPKALVSSQATLSAYSWWEEADGLALEDWECICCFDQFRLCVFYSCSIGQSLNGPIRQRWQRNQKMGAINPVSKDSMSGRFKHKGTVKLQHFGDVDLFEDTSSKRDVVGVVYDFEVGEPSVTEFISKLKSSNNSCIYLMNIISIESGDALTCSTNTNTFHIYFEYFPKTLQQAIAKHEEPFAQEEVKNMVKCLLWAVRTLNDRDAYHGDIYPDFIYVDEGTPNKYKIYDSTYFTPQQHGYYRALDKASYSAPEVLANISQRRTYPLYNHFISDTFSVGMVCLYAMTLIDPITAYRQRGQHKEIDYYHIEMLLRMTNRNGYSQDLVECVTDCLQAKNRPSALELIEKHYFLRENLSNDQKMSLSRASRKSKTRHS